MVENCEDCHVLTERIKNLAHWIIEGFYDYRNCYLPSAYERVARVLGDA